MLRSKGADNHVLKDVRRTQIMNAFVFACVVTKIPKTPKLIPMADDAITWGGIGGVGYVVYICDYTLVVNSEIIKIRNAILTLQIAGTTKSLYTHALTNVFLLIFKYHH